MPGKYVKTFMSGNKNDVADARAIWLAVQHPGTEVAVKTDAQQAILALHWMRQQLVMSRTMQTYCLRGLLTEYVEVTNQSRAALDRAIPVVPQKLAVRLPAVLIDTLREQWNRLNGLERKFPRLNDDYRRG